MASCATIASRPTPVDRTRDLVLTVRDCPPIKFMRSEDATEAFGGCQPATDQQDELRWVASTQSADVIGVRTRVDLSRLHDSMLLPCIAGTGLGRSAC